VIEITFNDIQDSIEELIRANVKVSGQYDLLGVNHEVSPIGDKDVGLHNLPRIEVMIRNMTPNREITGETTTNSTNKVIGSKYISEYINQPYQVRFGIIFKSRTNQEMNEMLYKYMKNIPVHAALTVNDCDLDYFTRFIVNQKVKDKEHLYESEVLFDVRVELKGKTTVTKGGIIEETAVEGAGAEGGLEFNSYIDEDEFNSQ